MATDRDDGFYDRVLQDNDSLRNQLAQSEDRRRQAEDRLGLSVDSWTARASSDLANLQLNSDIQHDGAGDRHPQMYIQQLQLDNCKLQQQLHTAADELQLLRHENQMFREDFLQERRDREAAHAQTLGLRGDLETTRRELEVTRELLSQYTGEAMASTMGRRQAAMEKIRTEYYQSQPNQLGGYRSRGIVVADGADDDDIIDSHDANYTSSGNDDLQCPSCDRKFALANHRDFLDHVDECTDHGTDI